MVKRDIFSKVSGAVRIVPLMQQQAQAAKVAAALGAAAAAHASERCALEAAVELGGVNGLELVNATLLQQHDADAEAAGEALQAGTLDAASYLAELAMLQQQLEDDQADLLAAAASCPDLPFYEPGEQGGESVGQRLRDRCGHLYCWSMRRLLAGREDQRWPAC